jgi:glycosyltransferase involved in cell wall biosynthesis
MPSRYEGLPLAGIEALGTGLACIFSDIPPLRELNPSSALWCAPNDVTALAHCLRSAAECPAEFKESNPSTYRARYGMGTMAQRYREYYAKLIE